MPPPSELPSLDDLTAQLADEVAATNRRIDAIVNGEDLNDSPSDSGEDAEDETDDSDGEDEEDEEDFDEDDEEDDEDDGDDEDGE